jgi:general secretion pathway protein J
MEVLVALVVMGMLFVVLTRGVRLGIDAWDAQSRAVALRDQLDDTDRALRLLLTRIDRTDESETTQLSGASDNIQFRTELPSAVSLISRRVDGSLYVDHDHRLIFSWSLHLHEHPLVPAPPPTKTELLAGIQSIELHYWQSAADVTETAGWKSSWQNATPPSLIKVHLAFPKGDPRHWPDIIVAPEIDRPAG